jgi:hypothetical protein
VVKWLGREADHSPLSIAEVKECVELYIHSPNTPSWHGAQLKKTQGQFELYLLSYNIKTQENLIVPEQLFCKI